MLEIERTQPKGLEPGIYFGLDEDRYHADPALGSTDLRNLRMSPPDYWWNTPVMNPEWEPEDKDDTPARLRGKAMHKLVLEGEKAFGMRFAKGPKHDPEDTPAEKGAATKAAKKALAPGRELLPHHDYERIAIAGAMISKNPKLAGAFQNGVSEVSIFWNKVVDGGRKVRCKCRIDYLKPRGVGDLKSITNVRKIEFRHACRTSMATYRYDMQAAHYLEGRAQVRELVSAGRVHGDHDPAFLKQVEAAPGFAFQFVFFQAADAPVTWSTILSPKNPIIENAANHNMEAAEAYLDYLETFGANNIWLILDAPRELAMEEMPAWAFR